MRRALLTVTCGAALLMLHAPAAFGMGFGRTVTTTTLGQTLNFAAIVALDVDESLARECVGAEVMIGDAKVAAENVRTALESVREKIHGSPDNGLRSRLCCGRENFQEFENLCAG